MRRRRRGRSLRGSASGAEASSSAMPWISRFSSEQGIASADAVVVATERRQHERRRLARSSSADTGLTCVVVRVLDPHRAAFYAERGLRTVCPTQTAIATLVEVVRASEPSPVGTAGTTVRDRRRRRQGRSERHPLAAPHGPRGDARRAAARPVRAARGRARTGGAARRRDRDPRPRAGRHRAAAGDRARRHGRRRGQHRHLADRARRATGSRRRSRASTTLGTSRTSTCSASPRPCAPRPGLLGLVEHEVPEHGMVRLLELRQRRARDRRAAGSRRCTRGGKARGGDLRSRCGAKLVSVTRNGVAELGERADRDAGPATR